MESELVEPQLPVGYRASVPTPTELPAPLKPRCKTFAMAGGTGR